MFSDTFLLLTVVVVGIFVVTSVLTFGISRMVIRWLLNEPCIDRDTLGIAISISLAASLLPPIFLWNILIIIFRLPGELNIIQLIIQLLAYSAGTAFVLIVVVRIVFTDKIRALRSSFSEAVDAGQNLDARLWNDAAAFFIFFGLFLIIFWTLMLFSITDAVFYSSNG